MDGFTLKKSNMEFPEFLPPPEEEFCRQLYNLGVRRLSTDADVAEAYFCDAMEYIRENRDMIGEKMTKALLGKSYNNIGVIRHSRGSSDSRSMFEQALIENPALQEARENLAKLFDR
jgi:hypothetical protein